MCAWRDCFIGIIMCLDFCAVVYSRVVGPYNSRLGLVYAVGAG